MIRTYRRALATCLATLAISGCRHGGPIAVAPPAPAPVKYALPKTVLVVEVQVQRDSELPGKYCDLMDLFFPELELAAVCQQPGAAPGAGMLVGKQRTSVLGYALTLKGEPDPDRTHEIKFDSSWNIDRTDSLTFSEGGLLTGAEMQRADRTMDIILGVAANVAKIAGRFVFGAGDIPAKIAAGTAPWERIDVLKENFSLMTAARQAAYRAYWATPEGRARIVLAARSYENIGHDLGVVDSLPSSQSGPSAAALVADLRERIAGRLADDFTGQKKKETWSPVYELTPPAVTKETPPARQASHSFSLFKFAGCGVREETTLPVRNSLSVLRCAKTAATLQEVSLSVATPSGKPASRVGGTVAAGDLLYVIRPEAVTLSLAGSCRAEETLAPPIKAEDPPVIVASPAAAPCKVAAQSAWLAQWGIEVGIPKAGKDYAYQLSLYEATGAVKSIKLSSKANLDQATIDKAFGIANSLLDASDAAAAERQKAADAAAAAADELAVLTRDRQILEERAKIKTLCAQLELPNCGADQ